MHPELEFHDLQTLPDADTYNGNHKGYATREAALEAANSSQ